MAQNIMAKDMVIAKTLEEAVSQGSAADALFLAGGTEITRLGSLVPAEGRTLVWHGKVPSLKEIAIVEDRTPRCSSSPEGGKLIRIGSMCTFQDIVESTLVPSYLKQACLFMASRTKRNMATIGGNVALRRDDSYLYATLLAAGARLELVDAEGCTFYRCTRHFLEEGKDCEGALIAAVLLPCPEDPSAVRVASKRYANTAQSHAVLTVSAGFRDGVLRLAVAAKNAGLVDLGSLARALQGLKASEITDSVVSGLVSACPLSFTHDMFGSPEYKKYLLAVTIADLVKSVMGGKA